MEMYKEQPQLNKTSYDPDYVSNRTATAVTPMMRTYNDLENSISALAETVDTLRVRLQPVLGVHRNLIKQDGGPMPPEEDLSPLGTTIRSDRKRVEGIVSVLADILDCLEL